MRLSDLVFGGGLLLAAAAPTAAMPAATTPATTPVTAFTVRFPAPSSHGVEITAELDASALPPGDLELMMAVWTPGSYLVREYSRQIERVEAFHGPTQQPIEVEKTAKNRWRVHSAGLTGPLTYRYRLYCRELTVRTNFVDAEFALLNGAATFLVPSPPSGGPLPFAYQVRLELPPSWRRSLSPLPAAPGGAPHTYFAADYDTLVDSPLYAGNGAVTEVLVEGAPHLLLHEGAGTRWDVERSAADVAKIVQAHHDLWGHLPYRRYVFFNLVVDTSGGLEHRDSTVLMTGRHKPQTTEGYIDWLSLVSHEHFHAWNVKQLRPVELGPFDYEREVYTPSLWQAEGVTSYYDDLQVHRAGLSTRKEYLRRLSDSIETLETAPGRTRQTLAESSFDAWVKHYRPDENSRNTNISYYTKGAVVAFLLDAEIRRATGGDESLDDAMRRAYERFSGERGFRPAELEELISAVAGVDLGPFFDHTLRSTAPLDYQPALDWYGLRFASPEKKKDGEDDAGYLGAETTVTEERLVVTRVPSDSPAAAAGLNVEDEILAFDGYRVPPRGLADRLKSYRPGTRATLLVARRERLMELTVEFGTDPGKRWKLEEHPDATAEQKARLEAWLAPLQGKQRSQNATNRR